MKDVVSFYLEGMSYAMQCDSMRSLQKRYLCDPLKSIKASASSFMFCIFFPINLVESWSDFMLIT